MRDYTSIREAFANVLPVSLAKAIALELSPTTDWFIDAYQSRVKVPGQPVTIGQLLDAVQHSEQLFKQYPVDRKSIKEIAHSLFIENKWLKRQPSVARVLDKGNDSLFIIGGRHRTYAIAAAMAQLCHLNAKGDELEAEETYNSLLHSVVQCELSEIDSIETLVSLVSADNESRRMRGAEQAHVKAQMLGASADGTDDVFEVATRTQKLTPKEQVAIAAQVFTRRSHPRLKAQTLQVIGERVASYLLFSVLPGERLSRRALATRELELAKLRMDEAYDTMCNLVEDLDVVAKNASDIAMKVIQAVSPASVTIKSTGTKVALPQSPEDEAF